VVKSFAVYIADIYTAITLLAFHHFNGSIYDRVQQNSDNTVSVPFAYGKWIFTGCIIFSFLLLAYEAHKSRAVIRSRDISYAYTNVMANNYYSIRSYDYFCFFCQINNSKKKKDELAFFIFFTFKGWKRLLVADGPRQVVNALTLYALAEVAHFSTNIEDYYENNIFTAIMLLTMLFTVIIFAGSAILLSVATLLYLPLICYIKGNLKEYCCHKIDKRISELVQKKKKQRLGKYAAIARAEAAGDFSHLMNKKGIIVGRKMVQPTLPQLDVNLMEDDAKMIKKNLDRNGSISSSTAHGGYYGSEKNLYGMKEGEEYGSTAQLMLNQGHAGSSLGHRQGNANSSLSSATLNGNPSLPPTVHNSPDSYPMQVRGMQNVQDVMRSQGNLNNSALLSQMGPIGTSPDVFAKRMVGRSGTLASTGEDARELAGGAASPALSAHRLAGAARSPLAPKDVPEAYQENGYYGHNKGNGDPYMFSNVGVDYPPPSQTNGMEGVEYPPPMMPSHEVIISPPTDLSAYAPYHQDGSATNLSVHQEGESQQGLSRVQSFSDVYEAYYQEHDEHDGYGGYAPHEMQQGNVDHQQLRDYYQGYDQQRQQQQQQQVGHEGYNQDSQGNHYSQGQQHQGYHQEDGGGYANQYPTSHYNGPQANYQAEAYGQDGNGAHAGHDQQYYPQDQQQQQNQQSQQQSQSHPGSHHYPGQSAQMYNYQGR